jgi:deoxyribose-phosphate aldolase
LEVIGLITDFVGDAIKVKAAGGIRDLGTLLKMLDMGVARFGINQNSAIEIIAECRALS